MGSEGGWWREKHTQMEGSGGRGIEHRIRIGLRCAYAII